MQCPPEVLLQRLTERARTSGRADDEESRIKERVANFEKADLSALMDQLSKNPVYEVWMKFSGEKGAGADTLCRLTARVRSRKSGPSSGDAYSAPSVDPGRRRSMTTARDSIGRHSSRV
jgi:hypothetical protein